jgi:hypothetical protein
VEIQIAHLVRNNCEHAIIALPPTSHSCHHSPADYIRYRSITHLRGIYGIALSLTCRHIRYRPITHLRAPSKFYISVIHQHPAPIQYRPITVLRANGSICPSFSGVDISLHTIFLLYHGRAICIRATRPQYRYLH